MYVVDVLLDDFSEYNLADALGSVPENFIRSVAFVEGVHSHTKIAVPDPVENKTLRIGAPEAKPGIEVAAPEQPIGVRVARPGPFSTNGDFSRPIQVSGENGESRRLIGMKLYGVDVRPVPPRRR